jgi:hypothetical protein
MLFRASAIEDGRKDALALELTKMESGSLSSRNAQQ